jgi:hypothetical protein
MVMNDESSRCDRPPSGRRDGRRILTPLLLEPGREKVRVGGLAPDTAARTYDMTVEVLYSISFYFYGA